MLIEDNSFTLAIIMRKTPLHETLNEIEGLFKTAVEGHEDYYSKKDIREAVAHARSAIHELTIEVEGPRLIDRVRIGLRESQAVRKFNHAAAQRGQLLQTHIALDSDNISNYWVEVYEFKDDYHYRVADAVIKIHYSDYASVLQEPSLYYFSTAYKLHCRLQKAGMGEHR